MKHIILIILAFTAICECSAQKISFKKQQIFYDSKGFPEPGAMYPRIIRLQMYKKDKGALLATFEKYIRIDKKPEFPIYRSIDDGNTWKLYSKVTDTKNNFGMRYQPQLFELPRAVNGLPAGTLLCAGSSIPQVFTSTELLLYKSNDGGLHWQYVSSIIKGGGIGPTIPVTDNVVKSGNAADDINNPVWEPFLEVDKKGRLICFYSDERYKAKGYNQLLAHKVSDDGGKTWNKEVFDVAIDDKVKRPGMIVTAALPDGKYIMVYEMVGLQNNPVYCRFSSDGENWGDANDPGIKIIDSNTNFFMSGTPYIIWTPAGGKDGTLVLTAKGTVKNGMLEGNGLMINTHLGKGSWKYMPTKVQYDATLHPGGYSRSMALTEHGKKILLLTPVPVEGNRCNLILTREKVVSE